MSLGNRLRQLRKNKGWTLEEAFKASGVSGSNISRLEDDQSPRVAACTLAALARAYRVDVRELFQAAGWYSEPPEILEAEAKRLSREEQLLIDAIRTVRTRSFRERLLRILIGIANLLRSADAERYLLNGPHLAAEWSEEYEPEQDA